MISHELCLPQAFDEEDLIPSDILWRPKEAFSDGVSSAKRSWHHILKDHIEEKVRLRLLSLPVTAVTTCHCCHYLSLLSLPVTAVTTCHCCHYLSLLSLPVTAVTTCHCCHYLSLLSLPVTAVPTCHCCHYLSLLSLPVTAVNLSSCEQ